MTLGLRWSFRLGGGVRAELASLMRLGERRARRDLEGVRLFRFGGIGFARGRAACAVLARPRGCELALRVAAVATWRFMAREAVAVVTIVPRQKGWGGRAQRLALAVVTQGKSCGTTGPLRIGAFADAGRAGWCEGGELGLPRELKRRPHRLFRRRCFPAG